MLGRMVSAINDIEGCKAISAIMPEVRMNMVYAKEDAKEPKDVVAIDGRITIVEGMPKAAGKAKFGASSHMARMMIELMKKNPEMRAGINFVYTPKLGEFLVEYCKEKGWLLGNIDRSKEPEDMAEEKIPSMPWKAEEAINSTDGIVPKIFYEHNAVGKEDLTVLIGSDPIKIAKETCDLAEKYLEWTR